MSEDQKLQESVKKTQDLLGKYIKKPPLTDKLLKKPPFRFIHDIITSVIKETGFLKNLFTPDESDSSNIKDKEAKLAYLTKLIDAVKLITGNNDLAVRPSKIISGQEPIKTNELLQAIGRALAKKVSSTEAIEYYKKNQEKKEKKSIKANISPDEKARKTVKKSSGTENNKPSSRDRTRDREDKPKRESRGSKETKTQRADSSESKDSRVSTRESRKKEEVSSIKKRKGAIEKSSTNVVASATTPPQNDVESPKTTVEDHTATAIPVEAVEKPEETKNERENDESEVMLMAESKNLDVTVAETPVTMKNPGLLRPPTARPPSARPGAPRIRGKTDFVINNSTLTPMGDVSVIVENFDIKDDDNEEMVVVQTTTVDDPSLIGSSDLLDSQLTAEHGYLVAQILETQRELVNEGNVELIPNKVEIEWDQSGSKKDRDNIVKEVDKLRGTIQSLTRTTNPLGKLLDFLQEDAEIMEKEHQDWQKQFNEYREQLIIERNTTKEALKPLEESLKEVEITIANQMEKIFQTKANIMKNNQKIQKLLSGR